VQVVSLKKQGQQMIFNYLNGTDRKILLCCCFYEIQVNEYRLPDLRTGVNTDGIKFK
jgi:hypothetical protein